MATSRESSRPTDGTSSSETDGTARRAFLINCAKYAATMPPAISLLLSAPRQAGAHVVPACNEDPPPDPEENPHCEPGHSDHPL